MFSSTAGGVTLRNEQCGTHQPGLGEEKGYRIKTSATNRQDVQYKNTECHSELGAMQREGPEDPPVFPDKPIISPALTFISSSFGNN